MRPLIVLATAALLLATLAAAQAQAPDAQAGAQADAGAAIFATHCAACHGETMTGGDHGPALKGAAFWSQWQNAPARPLYSRILSTMPANDPGSLAPGDALALVAHIARANGHPLPAAAPSPDALNRVILVPGVP